MSHALLSEKENQEVANLPSHLPQALDHNQQDVPILGILPEISWFKITLVGQT